MWGLAYQNDLILRDDNLTTSGDLGKTGSGFGRRSYVQQDANWNVTSVVDTTGAVQLRLYYDAYGDTSLWTSNYSTSLGWNSGNTYAWMYGFQGGRRDAAGNWRFGVRDYNPGLDRWLEPEPFGGAYVDGENLYQMEGDNPVKLVDPTGFDAGWARHNPTPYDPYLYGPDAPDQPMIAGLQGSPIPGTPYRGVWEYSPDGSSHYHIVDSKGNRIGTENSDGSPHDGQTLEDSIPNRYIDKIRDWAKKKSEKQKPKQKESPKKEERPKEEPKKQNRDIINWIITADRIRQLLEDQAIDQTKTNCDNAWDWLNNELRNVHIPWPWPLPQPGGSPAPSTHK